MEMSPLVIQIWIASMFTVFIYTFPFKDNPLFRFAEHVYVGAAIAFGVVMMVENIRTIAWVPMVTKGDFVWIFPILLGLLLYARFSKNYYWLARYPLAFIIAIGTALAMRTIVTSDFLSQIRDTIINPIATSQAAVVGDPRTPVNNILVILIVIATLSFFIFSGGTTIQKYAPMRWLNLAGRYFMMVAFGASFGTTIMTRVAFMIDRVRYVIQPRDWPFLPVLMLMVLVAMIPKERIRKPKA